MDKPVFQYNPSGSQSNINNRWWREDDPADHVIAVARAIEANQTGLRERSLAYARLYSNQPVDSLYATGVATSYGGKDQGDRGERYGFNVIQSCIDTVAAKIAKNRTRVQFQTDGANFKKRQQAKGLTKFVDGCFYATNTYEEAARCFVDGEIFGDGWYKAYVDGDKIAGERVLPFELIFDETESVYGWPPSLYQRKFYYRDVAWDLFGKTPEMRLAIENASCADPGQLGTRATDMIPIYEAWHLPSSDGGDGGKHVIAVQGATLAEEKWRHTWFPFARFAWTDRVVGLRGQGIAEQLVRIQWEINKLLQVIQRSQHLMCVPRIYLERGSKVAKSHLNNDPGAIVEYTGTPPVIAPGVAVSPEIYGHLKWLIDSAYQIVGVAQLSATAQKPAGLDAAVALREFHDIESERFVRAGQRFEQFHLDIAKIMIGLARDLYTRGVDVAVRAEGNKSVELIRWSDVNLDADAYVMKAYPTSILPSTPAGRLQRVQELYQSDLLNDPSPKGVWARSMLDFPDLEDAMSLQNAAMDDARRVVAAIADDGEYSPPEVYMDLALTSQIAQSTYLRGRAQGMRPERLELLRRLIDDCHDLQREAATDQSTTAPEQPAMPAAPQMAAPAAEPMPPIAPQMPPVEALPTPAVPSDLPA
jgi:hypothetical protein